MKTIHQGHLPVRTIVLIGMVFFITAQVHAQNANARLTLTLRNVTLKEFTIQAISKGSDDMGKVHMQVEYDNHIYYGFGANTDIIAASVEAYNDCINKFKM